MGLGPQINQDAAKMQGAAQARTKLFGANDPTFDYLTGSGDPTSSPLYKSFLNNSREAISNTYDNAVMNARGNANARGFGYASPNEQTNELGVHASEAGQLSKAPSAALQETIPFELQAAQGRIAEGSQLTSVENNSMDQVNKLAMQSNQNKLGMLNSLAKLAGTVLGGPIGGDIAGLVAPGGGGGGGGTVGDPFSEDFPIGDPNNPDSWTTGGE